jgi:hypothetical protein
MTRATLALGATVLVALGVAGTASAAQPDIEAARQATARFHNLAVTQASGYGQFADAAGVLCIDLLGQGGMGVHYVNGGFVGNPSEDVSHPEALVYAPDDFGRLKLAAAEYIVDKATWDATHSGPPRLFGQDFLTVPDGNRFGLAAFYERHAWLWKPNPSGFFNDWNPRVFC